jgi:hypothetical protein
MYGVYLQQAANSTACLLMPAVLELLMTCLRVCQQVTPIGSRLYHSIRTFQYDGGALPAVLSGV